MIETESKLSEDMEFTFQKCLDYFSEQSGEELSMQDKRYARNWVNDFKKLKSEDQTEEFGVYENAIWDYIKSKL